MNILFYLTDENRVEAYNDGLKTNEEIKKEMANNPNSIWLEGLKEIPQFINDDGDWLFIEDGKMVYKSYKYPVTQQEPYQPTNAEVAQQISDLQVQLILAGVIDSE